MDNEENLTTHSLEHNVLESELMDRELITKCDEPFLMQVEQDLVDIIIFQKLRFWLKQRRGLLRPFYVIDNFLNKLWPNFRKLSLVLCTLAILFLLYKVIFEPFDLFFITMLFIYIVLTSVIWVMKNWKFKNYKKLANYIDRKSAELSAKEILKVATKILPFDAHYHFSDSLVTYHRLKDENTEIVFSKELDKFAIVHSHATLLYKSSTAMFERMLIMHDDRQQMIDILARLGIEFITYTPEIYNDLLEELNDTIY